MKFLQRMVSLPVLVFAGNLVLRLALISKGPYHVDVLDMIPKAQQWINTGTLSPLFGSGYPLATILAGISMKVSQVFSVDDPVFAANMVSVIFGALTAVAFFILARELFGVTAATLSTMLFSVSPIFLALSVYGKNHVATLFFFLQALVSLLFYAQGRGKKHLYLAALLLGFMGACRLQDLILLSGPTLFFLLAVLPEEISSRATRIKKNDLWVIVGVTVLVVVCFHLPFLIGPGREGYLNQFTWFWKMGVTENYISPVSSQLVIAFIYLDKTLTEVGILLAVLGLARLAVKKRREFLFLFLWILFPLAFYGNLQTASTPRFFLIILPPFFLAMGYFLAAYLKAAKFFRVVILVLVVVMEYLMFSSVYPTLRVRHEHAYLPEFCEWIKEQTEPDAVIVATDEIVFVRYYAGRQVLARPKSFGHISATERALFLAQVDALLAKGTPVYFTSPSLYSYDRYREFSGEVLQRYVLTSRGTRPYEDWHKGEMSLQVFGFDLYKIEQNKR